MISGTSYDAIDVAVAEFDQAGTTLRCRPVGMISRAIGPVHRARIAGLLPPNATTINEVCRLDSDLGRLFGSAASEAITTFGEVDLVVSHGQTVFHWVEDRTALGTLQLGSAAWIAEATRTPVLADVRTRDIARGGQGAPLAAIFDALLLLSDEVRRGSLNLGGISNITVRDGDVIAYDIGPASALMDLAVSQATDGAERMDADGVRATRGTVQQDLLTRLLDEPYYRLDPPKSTGKERFNADYLATMIGTTDLELDDLVATLTELTARLVAGACDQHRLDELVVAGGGVRNPTLMQRITDLAPATRIRTIDDFGVPAQAKEAYLMALVGYLSWHGLPGTITSATGASSVLGSVTPGAGPLQLPTEQVTAPDRMVII
jgi:anhydro-N-acetylmuramic acid kinase